MTEVGSKLKLKDSPTGVPAAEEARGETVAVM